MQVASKLDAFRPESFEAEEGRRSLPRLHLGKQLCVAGLQELCPNNVLQCYSVT